MKSSLEIAQDAILKPIEQIAEDVGLEDEEFEPYGRYKAKIDLGVLERMKDSPNGKLVCVTGMTPTKAGEGKTTTLVGLTQGLGVIGKHPSLTDLDQGDLKFGIDFRSVYATVLQNWLDTPSKPILGGQFQTLGMIKA